MPLSPSTKGWLPFRCHRTHEYSSEVQACMVEQHSCWWQSDTAEGSNQVVKAAARPSIVQVLEESYIGASKLRRDLSLHPVAGRMQWVRQPQARMHALVFSCVSARLTALLVFAFPWASAGCMVTHG
jgi:hypothetical protein